MTEDLVESHTGADGMGHSGRGAKAEIEHEDEQPSAPEIVDDSVSGALCQVRSGGGGGDSWCDAVMVGVLSNGQIRVVMGGGEDEDGEPSVEDVDADCVRDAEDGTIPIDSRAGLESKDEDVYEGDDDDDNFDIALDDAKNQSKDGNTREVYRGVPAPKRFKATETVSVSKKTLPEKFLVRDGDDEAVRDRKRKQAKAFKGKQRMIEKDVDANTKKHDWQSFQAKVGGKKKTGFMSKKVGKAKGSMFSSKE